MMPGVTIFFPGRWIAKQCIAFINQNFPAARGRFSAYGRNPTFHFAEPAQGTEPDAPAQQAAVIQPNAASWLDSREGT